MFVLLPALAALALVSAQNNVMKPTDPPSMTLVINGKAKLIINPVQKIVVKDEKSVIAEDQPNMYQGGLSPKLVLGPVDAGIRVPGTLDPASLVVRSEDGTVYEEGKDYTLDHLWGGIGRIAGGRISPKQTVLIDYTISLQRIDAVEQRPDGRIVVKEGTPSRVCPEIPTVDAGSKRLANIFLPFNAGAVTDEMIYRIDDPELTWRRFIKIDGKIYTAHVRRMLKEGKPVKIVFYGDSVTVGCSVSSWDLCFASRTVPELMKMYPEARVEAVNAGIGGSNSEARFPSLDKEVLSFKPDLVVVEFVNDMPFDRDRLRSNYYKLIDKVREANSKTEIVILTPHFVRSDWMGHFHESCQVLREVAREKQVALGDTANIWANASKAGIPYQTLLANEINHPNNLGHMFYLETILEFFK